MYIIFITDAAWIKYDFHYNIVLKPIIYRIINIIAQIFFFNFHLGMPIHFEHLKYLPDHFLATQKRYYDRISVDDQ